MHLSEKKDANFISSFALVISLSYTLDSLRNEKGKFSLIYVMGISRKVIF